MKLIPRLLFAALLALFSLPALTARAAPPHHIAWKARLNPANARAGKKAQIVVTGTIDSGWHIYSLKVPAGGPFATTVTLPAPGALTAAGSPMESKPILVHDKGFNMDIREFANKVTFVLPVKIKPGAKGVQRATVQIRYQACTDKACLPPLKDTVTVSYRIGPDKARNTKKKLLTSVPAAGPFVRPAVRTTVYQPLEGTLILVGGPEADSGSAPGKAVPTDATRQRIDDAKRSGLLPFLLLSFSFGFLALLTPCVFPIIPITVSYFTKRKAGQRGGGTGGAVAYCLGIITTFTVIGVGVTLIFGGDKLSRFATNPIVNIGFALLFIVLALNLMGLFELPLPSGLAARAQVEGEKRGGYVQPFLLGLAFSLTSFTCTTAYVGTLLASAAKGDRLYPIIGMLGFSTAFALPFFLLALFPQALAKLPKSGTWMITVKAFMGMLELAAALKFLSNADLVWDTHLLTRPVFLALWAAIGIAAGLYLLGIVRLPRQDRVAIGPARRTLGAVTAVIGVYCFAAIGGAPLGWFGAFPPPPDYGQTLIPAAIQKPGQKPLPDAPIVWLETYDAALTAAKAQNKPILINFTGKTCTNCRLMENGTLKNPEVVRELHNYITAELYTDRGTPEDDKNQEFESKLADTIALPVYAAVTPDGKLIKAVQGLTSEKDFLAFLRQASGSASASL